MQTDRTRELETKGIGTLLLMYALPSVVSQIISSVYNICDRIFIGHGVGALAIAGLAITLPIINIIHAFGALIGVGAGATADHFVEKGLAGKKGPTEPPTTL